MTSVLAVVNNVANKVGFWAKQHAPQIMIVTGVVGGAAATTLACLATIKVKDDIDVAKQELADLDSLEMPEEEDKKERKKIYFKLTGKIAKRYAVPASVGTASVASILAGAGILNQRNANLTMGLAAVTSSFKEYRKGVISRYGEEVDKQIRFGLETIEVKEKEVDSDGKKKVVKKKIDVLKKGHKPNPMDYVRIFDWTNPYWDTNAQLSSYFLRCQQTYFNDKLVAVGHVYFNEVLNSLGFDATKVGHDTGWVYDPDNPNSIGDNYIDFGMHEIKIPQSDDADDYLTAIMLDFNVDGGINNKIDWPDLEEEDD